MTKTKMELEQYLSEQTHSLHPLCGWQDGDTLYAAYHYTEDYGGVSGIRRPDKQIVENTFEDSPFNDSDHDSVLFRATVRDTEATPDDAEPVTDAEFVDVEILDRNPPTEW